MNIPIEIPRNAWIVVAASRKALLLRNEADALYTNLKVARILEAATNPRSAIEQTDWHEANERAFATKVAKLLETDLCIPAEGVTLAAGPHSLSELGKASPPAFHPLFLTVFNKALTHLTLLGIERHLSAT